MAVMIRGTMAQRTDVFKVQYERKSWWIFSWYVQRSRDKVSSELLVRSDEQIDAVIVNGERFTK